LVEEGRCTSSKCVEVFVDSDILLIHQVNRLWVRLASNCTLRSLWLSERRRRAGRQPLHHIDLPPSNLLELPLPSSSLRNRLCRLARRLVPLLLVPRYRKSTKRQRLSRRRRSSRS
jgi:hypothetical protein